MRSTNGWETRNGGELYYYHKERSGGRIRSTYVGRGAMGQIAAEFDAMERESHEARRIEEQQERNARKQLGDSIDALARLSRTLTEPVLIAGGFHQHRGGRQAWRNEQKYRRIFPIP